MKLRFCSSVTFCLKCLCQYVRRGSRIHTDRFPIREPKEQASQGNFLDLNSLNSPFLGFWVIQTGYWPVPFSTGEALQISGLSSRLISMFYVGYAGSNISTWKFFPIKLNLLLKTYLTDFRKTVEIGVDQRLYVALVALTLITGIHWAERLVSIQ